MYGAASGQRGGFFTIGAEGALCTRLYGPLDLVAGLYVGGGGGAAAPQGGGLMLRPHVDLMWDFGPLRAGLPCTLSVMPAQASSPSDHACTRACCSSGERRGKRQATSHSPHSACSSRRSRRQPARR